MTFIKKNFFILFLVTYLIFGSFYSLNTGISHDEFHEQQNWEYNVSLVENILFERDLDSKFDNFQDKYYGIGFQLISQPIQFFLQDSILKYQNVDTTGAHLLAKHFVIFLFYFISGIFVYLIISNIINNKYFSITSTILYLTYPYLLGHAFINPKDIPFLSFWIICTYLSLNLFNRLLENKKVSYLNVLLFSFLSAYLLSIRISGILIFIQYLITGIIYFHSEKINITIFLKKIYKKFLFFILSIIFFTFLLYPVFWKNPLLIFTAIEYMVSYFNDVCTLTWGKCMEAKKLDSTYIPIWLSVKLPLIILAGLLLLPFTEKKIFINKKINVYFGTLLITPFLISIILILKKVHLYDELRQILFLVPLFFMTGIISIYLFSKKIFYFFSIITLSLFLFENIKIYPYQYAWFNTPSRVLNLSKNFELDYWGVSGRELSKEMSTLINQTNNKPCVLVSPLWTIKHFLNQEVFNCYGHWSEIDSNFSRPFWAVQNVRNLKKGETYKCETVYVSKFNLLFTKEDFITGRLIKCI